MRNEKELWRLFTAQEEYDANLTDKFNRNPYWLSKNRNVFIPTVSEYLFKNGLKPYYPNNKKFALCLSHDIDVLYLTREQHIKNAAKSLWNMQLREFTKSLTASMKREINPNFHISKILKHEQKYNAKSSFNFLSLSSAEQDFNYDLREITELFDEILENNGEIGLHGGHLAYNNILKIKQEKEQMEAVIGRPVSGYRNHYLRFETPSTWEYLDELNFKYDTTYGFADCVGFRNGMCYPFHPYSLDKKTFLDIVELPLIIMDGTLLDYMKLSEKNQFKLCKQLIDIVAHNCGVLTLSWHNDGMQGYKGELYAAILKYADDKGAWMPTSNDIVDFWKESKFLEIEKTLLEQLKNA